MDGEREWALYDAGDNISFLEDAINALEQPEIVRCKDCKWQDPADMSSGYTWCDMLCRQMKLDDFCSNGKEKT